MMEEFKKYLHDNQMRLTRAAIQGYFNNVGKCKLFKTINGAYLLFPSDIGSIDGNIHADMGINLDSMTFVEITINPDYIVSVEVVI